MKLALLLLGLAVVQARLAPGEACSLVWDWGIVTPTKFCRRLLAAAASSRARPQRRRSRVFHCGSDVCTTDGASLKLPTFPPSGLPFRLPQAAGWRGRRPGLLCKGERPGQECCRHQRQRCPTSRSRWCRGRACKQASLQLLTRPHCLKPSVLLQAVSSAFSLCATSGDASCFSKAQSDALAKYECSVGEGKKGRHLLPLKGSLTGGGSAFHGRALWLGAVP